MRTEPAFVRPEDISVRVNERTTHAYTGNICLYTHPDTEKHDGDLSFSIIRCLLLYPSSASPCPPLPPPTSPDTVVESGAMMRVLVKPGE